LTGLLNATDVAELLRCSKKTIYAYADAGLLPAARLSPKVLRFRREDVEAFIAASLTTGGRP
jgi:excisionase family DNA binding protein